MHRTLVFHIIHWTHSVGGGQVEFSSNVRFWSKFIWLASGEGASSFDVSIGNIVLCILSEWYILRLWGMRWGIRPNQLPQHEAWLMLLKMDSSCKNNQRRYREILNLNLRLWGMRWGETQAWSVWYIWSNLVWWGYWDEVVRYEMREDPSMICVIYLEQPSVMKLLRWGDISGAT